MFLCFIKSEKQEQPLFPDSDNQGALMRAGFMGCPSSFLEPVAGAFHCNFRSVLLTGEPAAVVRSAGAGRMRRLLHPAVRPSWPWLGVHAAIVSRE